MKVLSPSEIKQPKPGLVLSPPTVEDWEKDHPTQDGVILGAVVREELFPTLDCTPFITEYEVQRNGIFDPYDCVTCATWNKIQCLAKRKYGIVLDYSKRWTAVKSGTRPGIGNSVTNVEESVRVNDGGVRESLYPTMTPSMSESQFYAAIPPEVDALEDFKNNWQYNHEWLGRARSGVPFSSLEQLKDGLKLSPLSVSVGPYHYDANGSMYEPSTGIPEYIHQVIIVKIDNEAIYTLDSENGNGLIRYRLDYPFGYPKLSYLKKKTMIQPLIYKQKGKAALYALNPLKQSLMPFGDGAIPGGELFMTLYGVKSYKDIPRVMNPKTGEDWEKLPFPIFPYLITSTPMQGASIVEEVGDILPENQP